MDRLEVALKRLFHFLWIHFLSSQNHKLPVYEEKVDHEDHYLDHKNHTMIDSHLGEDYILEVSTPGVDRKFFDVNQLSSYIGEDLEFKTREMYEGKRKFIGKLTKCDDSYFSISNKNMATELKFKFSDIDFCKLKPNYNDLIKEYSHAK